jgi:hypothetical protein
MIGQLKSSGHLLTDIKSGFKGFRLKNPLNLIPKSIDSSF